MKRKIFLPATAVALVTSLTAWWLVRGGRPALPEIASWQGDAVVEVLPAGKIPAIDQPVFVPATRATFLTPAEPVLGVVVGGQAKAYSLYNLDLHEVVNDSLGGRPITVTW